MTKTARIISKVVILLTEPASLVAKNATVVPKAVSPVAETPTLAIKISRSIARAANLVDIARSDPFRWGLPRSGFVSKSSKDPLSTRNGLRQWRCPGEKRLLR